MAKHRRWSDKPKPDPAQNTEKQEFTEQEFTPGKTSSDSKSILQSGTKYVYIVVIAALFSGVFTPITLGIEIESVVYGILSILLGLVGAILIIKGINSQKPTLIVSAGIGVIFISLITMLLTAGKTLFGFSI